MYRFQKERRHGPIWRVRSKKPCPNDSRHDLAIFQSAADSFLGTAVKTQRNIYEKVPTEAFKHRCEKTRALFFGEKKLFQRSHIKSGYACRPTGDGCSDFTCQKHQSFNTQREKRETLTSVFTPKSENQGNHSIIAQLQITQEPSFDPYTISLKVHRCFSRIDM